MFPVDTGNKVIERKDLGIYRPESYGTPSGSDASIDALLVQKCFNEAAAAGGGTIKLEGTYAYKNGSGTNLGPYQNIDFGLWCNGSNIIIDGGGRGVLKLAARPTYSKSYIGLLIGNGGGFPLIPSWDVVYVSGTWLSNVSIRGLTFDNSVLTSQDQDILTTGTIGSCVLLSFVKESSIVSCFIDKGYGSTGALATHCSSIRNYVGDCIISGAFAVGYWFDGSDDSVFERLRNPFITGTTHPVNMSLAINTDYKHGSSGNVVKDCLLIGGHIVLGVRGKNQTILGCDLTTSQLASTHLGIDIGIAANVAGKWEADNILVTGTTIRRGSGTFWGFQIAGVNINGYDSLPLEAKNIMLIGNTIISSNGIVLVLGPQAKDNILQHNVFSISALQDSSGGTASGNIIGPNP